MSFYLSWDIGIKNLAYSYLYVDKNNKIFIFNLDSVCILPDKKTNVKNISKEKLVKYLYAKLNQIYEDNKFDKLTNVIIETQISKNQKAISMCSALQMYFLLRNHNVKCITASQKFKQFQIKCSKKYTERKKDMLLYCNDLLNILTNMNLLFYTNEISYNNFTNNRKKDDIADSLMMVLGKILTQNKIIQNITG